MNMWLTSMNSTRNSDINSPRPRNVIKGVRIAAGLRLLTSKLGKRHLLKQNTSKPLDPPRNYLTKTTVLTKSLPDLAPIQLPYGFPTISVQYIRSSTYHN